MTRSELPPGDGVLGGAVLMVPDKVEVRITNLGVNTGRRYEVLGLKVGVRGRAVLHRVPSQPKLARLALCDAGISDSDEALQTAATTFP